VPRLLEVEIARRLRELPLWELSGREIVRTLRLPGFQDVIMLVVRIAEVAEAADHHPDMDIRYQTLRLALTTYDEGGLTERDFELARAIDQLLPENIGGVTGGLR
jgi:4a-hydroxytetrahydrobiopterin dehydratase